MLDGNTTIRITTDKKFSFGAEGTVRNASWKALRSLKRKTIGGYKAAGGQVKYLTRWEKAGLIETVATIN